MTTNRALLSASATAAALGVKQETLIGYAKEGGLEEFFTIPSKTLRFYADRLEDLRAIVATRHRRWKRTRANHPSRSAG